MQLYHKVENDLVFQTDESQLQNIHCPEIFVS
jgi:hypothetical protein